MAALVCAVASGLLAVPVAAAAPDGFYVGAGAGLALVDTGASTLEILMGSPTPRLPARHTSAGAAVVASLGYGFGNGARVELEADWRRAGSGEAAASRYGAFVNALYEYDGLGDWISPYAGLGVGFQQTSYGAMTVLDSTGAIPVTVGSASAGHFAAQAIIGVAVPIAALPGLSATLEYRYTRAVGRASAPATVALPSGIVAGRASTTESGAHTVLVGLRYVFEGEASPGDGVSALPTVPTGDAYTRTYVVYFDWDSATITARARDVVAEAARASSHVAHTRLAVSGHTDRTGTVNHNLALSKARAEAIADELVRWGIRRDAIDIHAFGAERPAVETKDGVREERNRRVEIAYQ